MAQRCEREQTGKMTPNKREKQERREQSCCSPLSRSPLPIFVSPSLVPYCVCLLSSWLSVFPFSLYLSISLVRNLRRIGVGFIHSSLAFVSLVFSLSLVSPCLLTFLLASAGARLLILSIRRAEEYVAHSAPVNCLALGRNTGRFMATGGDDRKVMIWELGKPNAVAVRI